MHPSNRYLTQKPDFAALAAKYPSFAKQSAEGQDDSYRIDFQDAAALRSLTETLLKEDWGYQVELREDRLCPTLANRLDYLHHILDLQAFLPGPSNPKSARKLKILDVGTGHIAIYPLLLHRLRPDAEIVATEIDQVSHHHAIRTRQANDISSSSIALLRPTQNQPILFPIFEQYSATTHSDKAARDARTGEGDHGQWDVVICNPPFFRSEQEMKEGQDAKLQGAPAAPTAAANELITDGGEVDFVGQIIDESLILRERCSFYTSLIGKYSSLQPLVDRLRAAKLKHEIDNYFIKILRQARTTRWILGWSFTAIRLPDTFIRPDNFMPGTSFARLLPPVNSFTHTPSPAMDADELHRKVLETLQSVQLARPPEDGEEANVERGERVIRISPTSITWSRAARRAAARAESGSSQGASVGSDHREPLFVAKVRVNEGNDARASKQGGGHVDEKNKNEGPEMPAHGASLRLMWLVGRDRSLVEGLWKFILSKAGLLGGIRDV